MRMSFQEKMQWVLLGSLLLVFNVYFFLVLPPVSSSVLPNQIFLFALMVGLLVIFLIIGAIISAVSGRVSDDDERDRWNSLIGTRNGDAVLGFGVLVSLCVALVTEGNFIFTHVLLGFWVAAQVTEHVTQLILYRRGR